MTDRKAVVLMITKMGMGASEGPELPLRLLGKFLALLGEMEPLPRAICFYTQGIKLVCRGSPVLDLLGDLERRGVRLVICSTCLDHYELRDEVQVGVVGGMGDILTAMWGADKVVTL